MNFILLIVFILAIIVFAYSIVVYLKDTGENEDMEDDGTNKQSTMEDRANLENQLISIALAIPKTGTNISERNFLIFLEVV